MTVLSTNTATILPSKGESLSQDVSTSNLQSKPIPLQGGEVVDGEGALIQQEPQSVVGEITENDFKSLLNQQVMLSSVTEEVSVQSQVGVQTITSIPVDEGNLLDETQKNALLQLNLLDLQVSEEALDSSEDAPIAPLVILSEAIKNGERLPHQRQTVTTVQPSAVGTVLDSAIKPGSEKSLETELDEFSFLKEKAPVDSKKSDALVFDRVVSKLSSNEQAMMANKESAPIQQTMSSMPSPLNTQPQSSTQLPADLQQLVLSPQSKASEWGQAVGERVNFLINNKLNRAEIRIDPPHLGKLDIQIQVKDDVAVVNINTQQAQTKDLLDSASARLRDYLQDAGYTEVDVNISHQEKNMQQQASSEQDQGQPEDAASQEEVNSSLSGAVLTPSSITLDNGRIDFFA